MALKYMGSEAVVVDVPIRDETGKTIRVDKIEALRNTWNVSTLDKATVVEAVASTLIDSNVKNPEQRDVLKEADPCPHGGTRKNKRSPNRPCV